MAGKGSRNRTADKKAYDETWERIFGKAKNERTIQVEKKNSRRGNGNAGYMWDMWVATPLPR